MLLPALLFSYWKYRYELKYVRLKIDRLCQCLYSISLRYQTILQTLSQDKIYLTVRYQCQLHQDQIYFPRELPVREDHWVAELSRLFPLSTIQKKWKNGYLLSETTDVKRHYDWFFKHRDNQWSILTSILFHHLCSILLSFTIFFWNRSTHFWYGLECHWPAHIID